ncbi:MAG: hypothetical protein JNM07_00655 [Phycisphaerae bacterium]|nr:hypothetical protein [Phycisphaerae bacterium]
MIQPAPVVYQPPPVVQVPPPPVASGIEVVPADLRASAYQTKDTIIVHVSGVNRAPGYTTSLSVRDPNDLYAPVVLLRNWAPVGEAAGSASVPFTLNATVRANHPLSTLTLRIGDQVLVVPVEPVQPINN